MTSATVPRQECTRHRGFPWDRAKATTAYTVRCMHIGRRFVVEIQSVGSDFCVIDYVEDLPDGDVVVQGGGPGDWDAYVDKMLSGVAPQWNSGLF